MVLIHNVRLGFATNSSSTHSLIWNHGQHDSGVDAREFGWDFWTAASERAKRDYVGLILRSALGMPNDQALPIVHGWTGAVVEMDDAYVDHQSQWVVPRTWDERGIDRDFIGDLLAYITQPGLVLLGGNDNTEESHPLSNGAFRLPLWRDQDGAEVVARKDSRGYWTIFNRRNGGKLRIDFSDRKGVANATKADAPELVDVKVTDFCPFDCAYCYQGSTAAGKHADRRWLEAMIYELAQLRVFEIAFGGGEPTLYPDFHKLLHYTRGLGIVPNFTTRNARFLADEDVRAAVKEVCGGVAVSCENTREVEGVANRVAKHGVTNVSVQHVMGSASAFEVESLLHAAKRAHLKVTLLGWKTVGRGVVAPRHDYSVWTRTVDKLLKIGGCPTLGIDTALAAETDMSALPAWMYTTKEGAHSMYIDAVAQRWAPSSYAAAEAYRPATLSAEDLVRNFAEF